MHQLFFPYILQETWLLSLTTSVALKSDNISCEGLNHKQTQIISKGWCWHHLHYSAAFKEGASFHFSMDPTLGSRHFYHICHSKENRKSEKGTQNHKIYRLLALLWPHLPTKKKSAFANVLVFIISVSLSQRSLFEREVCYTLTVEKICTSMKQFS